MRFGWLAAAALVWAGHAGAQTFTQYRVTGTGTYQPTGNDIFPVGPALTRDFTAIFEVQTSLGVFYGSGYTFTSDGNTATASYPGLFPPSTSATGVVSGILSYGQSFAAHGGYGGNSSLSVNYDDADSIGGFPLAIASSAASGTFNDRVTQYLSGGGYYFAGQINSFAVLGTTNTFSTLNVSYAPEPATWLSMILGLAVVGFALRRRPEFGALRS